MIDQDEQVRSALGSLVDDRAIDAAGALERLFAPPERAIRSRLVVIAVSLLIALAGTVGVVAALRPGSGGVPIAEPPALQRATVPFARITYPPDWFLVDATEVPLRTQPDDVRATPGNVLILANFEPDVGRNLACTGPDLGDLIPTDGVQLRVFIADATPDAAASTAPWPVELSRSGEHCGGAGWSAQWRAPSGVVYGALAAIGPEASSEDREALMAAFSSIVVPDGDRPFLKPGLPAAGQTPSFVLGSGDVGGHAFALEAFRAGEATFVSFLTDEGGGAGAHGFDVPSPTLFGWGVWAYPEPQEVYGFMGPDIARVEITTVAGDAVDAEVVIAPLPASLAGPGIRVFRATVPDPEQLRVVAIDQEGNVITSN
jgi:hypothetical protein